GAGWACRGGSGAGADVGQRVRRVRALPIAGCGDAGRARAAPPGRGGPADRDRSGRPDPGLVSGPEDRLESRVCTAVVGPLQRVSLSLPGSTARYGTWKPGCGRARRAGVDGGWRSGKARDFGSRIRRFESFRPNHFAGQVRPAAAARVASAGETGELRQVRMRVDADRVW